MHTKNTENLLFVVVLKEAQFVNAEKVVVMLKVKNVHFVELEKIKNLDVVLSGADWNVEDDDLMLRSVGVRALGTSHLKIPGLNLYII